MPFLLACLMGFLAFFAALGAVVYVGIVLTGLLGDGPFTVNERPVSRAGFFAAMWPLFAALPVAIGAAASAAYGLRRERPWARPLLLGYGALNAALALGLAAAEGRAVDLAAAACWGALAVGFPAWYLYRKRSVVAYFRAVEAKSGARDA